MICPLCGNELAITASRTLADRDDRPDLATRVWIEQELCCRNRSCAGWGRVQHTARVYLIGGPDPGGEDDVSQLPEEDFDAGLDAGLDAGADEKPDGGLDAGADEKPAEKPDESVDEAPEQDADTVADNDADTVADNDADTVADNDADTVADADAVGQDPALRPKNTEEE